MRYASSLMTARAPSRVTASTPLRMLLTMSRKKRSPPVGADDSSAARRPGFDARRARHRGRRPAVENRSGQH